MPNITLNQQKISYSVQKSQRARYARLKISPKDGLQVVIPAGTDLNIEEFIRKNANWILKHHSRIEQAKQETRQRSYKSGEIFPFLGEERRLDIEAKARGKLTTVMLDHEAIQIRVGADGQPNDGEFIRAVLEGWYRHEAKAYIVRRVAELAKQHGFEYEKVTIKSQSTRWGSCSTKSNLNFNWKLMMTPPAAIDYVIIHELCHLREMNHSKKFWKLVARYCPDYKTWVKWFKLNSTNLIL
jgi:predicted metal-dependent hydrolase